MGKVRAYIGLSLIVWFWIFAWLCAIDDKINIENVILSLVIVLGLIIFALSFKLFDRFIMEILKGD